MISIFRSAAEKSLSVQRLIDGQEMLVLVLVLVVVLQFEGTRGQDFPLYHRAGENVVLPCNSPESFDTCSYTDWFSSVHGRISPDVEVGNGEVVQSSPRASRLNMDSNCSLIINNITADDAGLYFCMPPVDAFIGNVLLNVLTISPSPTDADPAKEDFTLLCSLVRYGKFGSCPVKSLIWVDETGSELTEGDGYKFRGQTGCVSRLTVNLQSSRRFTCQFVEGNKVKIEAHYGSEAAPGDITTSTIIILGSVIGVLLLLVVLAAVFIKLRKTRNKEDHKTTAENQDSAIENHQYDELQANLTYATVSHSKPSEKIKVQPEDETVTYSAVRTKKKTEADIDPSDLYSSLTAPK